MNTNTMMLIVLAVLIVLSAVGIWLANRGSGLTSADEVLDEHERDPERDPDTYDTTTDPDTDTKVKS